MQTMTQGIKGGNTKDAGNNSLVTMYFTKDLNNRISIDSYIGQGETYKKLLRGKEIIRITKDGKMKQTTFNELFKLI